MQNFEDIKLLGRELKKEIKLFTDESAMVREFNKFATDKPTDHFINFGYLIVFFIYFIFSDVLRFDKGYNQQIFLDIPTTFSLIVSFVIVIFIAHYIYKLYRILSKKEASINKVIVEVIYKQEN